MTSTNEVREFYYSDLHKDLYGCRPSVESIRRFNALPYEEKCAEYDRMCEWLGEQIDAEAVEDMHNEAAFWNVIHDLVKSGARDQATAIRWYLDSLNLSDSDLWYGGSYVTYHAHLPYSMSEIFEPYVKAMAKEREAA